MAKAPLTSAEVARIDALRIAGESGNYYVLLGLHRGSRKADVEAAYRDFVREWHPDRFFSRDVGDLRQVIEDNFVHATRAHRTLRDDLRRSTYDRELVAGGGAIPEGGSVDRSDVGEARATSDAEESSSHEVRVHRTKGSVHVEPEGAPKAPPRARPPPIVEKLRQQIAEQLARAKRYYEAGVQDYEAGQFTKAESALYLATRYDPKNTQYLDLYRQAAARARQGRSANFIQLAEQAEQYQRIREAIDLYRKATESDPAEGHAWYRLGALLKTEGDAREALTMYRKAALKEPKRIEFRLALGELYLELGMDANATREVTAAAEIQAGHERVKALQQKLRQRR